MKHPSQRLDDTVHQRTRLGILAVLVEGGRADFAFLRDTLELTDGNLSRNLAKLQEVGYVSIEKRASGARQRTWVTITRAGRAGLQTEINALRELIRGVDEPRGRSSLRPAPAS